MPTCAAVDFHLGYSANTVGVCCIHDKAHARLRSHNIGQRNGWYLLGKRDKLQAYAFRRAVHKALGNKRVGAVCVQAVDCSCRNVEVAHLLLTLPQGKRGKRTFRRRGVAPNIAPRQALRLHVGIAKQHSCGSNHRLLVQLVKPHALAAEVVAAPVLVAVPPTGVTIDRIASDGARKPIFGKRKGNRCHARRVVDGGNGHSLINRYAFRLVGVSFWSVLHVTNAEHNTKNANTSARILNLLLMIISFTK